MIELFEQQLQQMDRHSSKGNQLKWENNGIWYKADYTGYEGFEGAGFFTSVIDGLFQIFLLFQQYCKLLLIFWSR